MAKELVETEDHAVSEDQDTDVVVVEVEELVEPAKDRVRQENEILCTEGSPAFILG